jgi:hypothetical protein
MAVLANQREFVRRPGSITPQYGLFTVAQAAGTLSDQLPGHARQGGLEFATAICEQPTCYETNCLPDLGTKPAGEPYDVVTGDPFVVLTSLLCGSVGMTSELMTDMLRQRAIAGEQMLVENTFSTGACGQAPSLSNNAVAATDVGNSTDVVDAVSQLEAAFYAQYGLAGVLHVPYLASAYMMQGVQMYRDSAGVWRTPLGTAVSIGNYAGLDATGNAPAAGATNIYITSPVFIWRAAESDVFYTPFEAALNRSTNQVNAYREREYVVAFECLHFVSETTLVVV